MMVVKSQIVDCRNVLELEQQYISFNLSLLNPLVKVLSLRNEALCDRL